MAEDKDGGLRVAVVIPCFKVRGQILAVLDGIGPEVSDIFVVDDRCPEASGDLVQRTCRDPRVRVLRHEVNQGVGGATLTGYRAAVDAGCDVVVKMDGDGQMDPRYLRALVAPIADRAADYTKGNRFHSADYVSSMPWVRLVGNSALSFVNKAVSGYWHVMDPTNGYTAIHAAALRAIPFAKIDRRYFFESDVLFRLGLSRATVKDIPVPSRYADEISNLRIGRTLIEFPGKYMARLAKRLAYAYFIRDFNVGTVWILVSAICFLFSVTFGGYHWWRSIALGEPATAGTVMLAAMPFILGFQALIGAVQFDVSNTPSIPLQAKTPVLDFGREPATTGKR